MLGNKWFGCRIALEQLMLLSTYNTNTYIDQGPNTISFANNLAGQTITLNSALPPIDANIMMITGLLNREQPNVTVSRSATAATNFPVFNVSNTAVVTISAVTITNGTGYTLFNQQVGGGIYNSGALTLTNDAVTNNSVTDAKQAGGAQGGGIYNSQTATLTLTNTTVTGNKTVSTVFNKTVNGGAGIYNNGILTITGSTISTNTSAQAGGGIMNDTNGVVSVATSTISSNTASNGQGGGVYNISTQGGNPLQLRTTTFASNQAQGMSGFGGGV